MKEILHGVAMIIAWGGSMLLPVVYGVALYYQGDGMLALILFFSGIGVVWMWIMGVIMLFKLAWWAGLLYIGSLIVSFVLDED